MVLDNNGIRFLGTSGADDQHPAGERDKKKKWYTQKHYRVHPRLGRTPMIVILIHLSSRDLLSQNP